MKVLKKYILLNGKLIPYFISRGKKIRPFKTKNIVQNITVSKTSIEQLMPGSWWARLANVDPSNN